MTERGPIRVLVIDDSAYHRRTLAKIIDGDPHMEVVGTARDGKEGIKMVVSLDPDLVTGLQRLGLRRIADLDATPRAPLARRFARRASDAVGRARPVRLSDDAIAELRAHDWPGNVRELRNAVERAVTMTSADVVTAVDLPEALVRTSSAEARVEDLERELRAAEKQRVVDALERCGGNQTRAAKELGISRRTLLHRLDEFDLPRPRKRD